MISIYQKKKALIDLFLTLYLGFISFLGIFINIDKTFAFSGGLEIGGQGRGISLIDLSNTLSVSGDSGLSFLIDALIILLCLQIILNILHYLKAKETNNKNVYYIQIFSLIIWVLLIIVFGSIFNQATTPGDYNNLRIYGTAVFGIIGLLSIIIIGIFEVVWIGYFLNKSSTSSNFQQYAYYSSTPSSQPKIYFQKSGKMTLIIVYEIIMGISVILGGLLLGLLNQITIGLSRSFGSSPSGQTALISAIVPFILLWGVIGIVAGFLLNRWSKMGYYLSWIFLISTGILLFWMYLIPTLAMIFSIFYFIKNEEFNKNMAIMNVPNS